MFNSSNPSSSAPTNPKGLYNDPTLDLLSSDWTDPYHLLNFFLYANPNADDVYFLSLPWTDQVKEALDLFRMKDLYTLYISLSEKLGLAIAPWTSMSQRILKRKLFHLLLS